MDIMDQLVHAKYSGNNKQEGGQGRDTAFRLGLPGQHLHDISADHKTTTLLDFDERSRRPARTAGRCRQASGEA